MYTHILYYCVFSSTQFNSHRHRRALGWYRRGSTSSVLPARYRLQPTSATGGKKLLYKGSLENSFANFHGFCGPRTTDEDSSVHPSILSFHVLASSAGCISFWSVGGLPDWCGGCGSSVVIFRISLLFQRAAAAQPPPGKQFHLFHNLRPINFSPRPH